MLRCLIKAIPAVLREISKKILGVANRLVRSPAAETASFPVGGATLGSRRMIAKRHVPSNKATRICSG
jgi:hypothetical protein